MRLVFFATPALATPTLQALVDAGHDVVLVVTQADKRRGRGGLLSPSPVKVAAQRLGLPVSHDVRDVLEVEADLGVLVAFGRLIKPDVLEHLEILNLHPSLLPRWRGATPAEAAILAGDLRTGICVMRLVDEMDAGPIYAQYETEIAPDETAAALYERLFSAGNQLLVELLQHKDQATPRAQTGDATYCGKLERQDLLIDWNDDATRVVAKVRIGRAWTTFRDRRLLVLSAAVADSPEHSDQRPSEPGGLQGAEVATGSGYVTLQVVQPEGKGPMEALAWSNGARIQPSERLGH